MKLVIAGGGTGGHIYIGVAIAKEMKKRNSLNEIVFVGTSRGMESQIVPDEGFVLECIDSAGLNRVGLRNLFRSLVLVPRSLSQSRRILKAHQPEVVVGLGGYASGPVVLTAWWLGIPTMVIEPNVVSGLTNRILASFIDCAAVVPQSSGTFKQKAHPTGIPVREEFQRVAGRKHPSSLTILVYGGSQGSHLLNTRICAALPKLRSLSSSIRWIHQTGSGDLEMVREAYRNSGHETEVQSYLPRIYEQFSEADLIICRAGAGTIAEITVAGKASILVPFSKAADDHQTKNAKAMVQSGAACMISESELNADSLDRQLRRLLGDPEELTRMERAAKALGKPDAAQEIGDLIDHLAQ